MSDDLISRARHSIRNKWYDARYPSREINRNRGKASAHFSSMTNRFKNQVRQRLDEILTSLPDDAQSISGLTLTSISDTEIQRAEPDDADTPTSNRTRTGRDVLGTKRLCFRLQDLKPTIPNGKVDSTVLTLVLELHLDPACRQFCAAAEEHETFADGDQILEAYYYRREIRKVGSASSEWEDWKRAFDKIELDQDDTHRLATSLVEGEQSGMTAEVVLRL